MDKVDNDGVSPLMVACHHLDFKHCKLLVHGRCNVSLKDKNGWTALHYCAYSGTLNCLNLVLSAGANTGTLDNNKRSALDIARFQKNKHCIKILAGRQAKASALKKTLLDDID